MEEKRIAVERAKSSNTEEGRNNGRRVKRLSRKKRSGAKKYGIYCRNRNRCITFLRNIPKFRALRILCYRKPFQSVQQILIKINIHTFIYIAISKS